MLEQCQFVRELPEADRRFIEELGDVKRFVAGEKVIADGAESDGFYFLLSGKVHVDKDGEQLATLEAGSIVGEMALFNENARTSDVVAEADTELLRIDASAFARHVLNQVPAAVKLMEMLGRTMVERLQQQDSALVSRIAQADPALAQAAEGFGRLKRRMIADWSLKYHAIGRPGKLQIAPTKASGTAADLSVAYSPGVAEPCLAIRDDIDRSYEFTARANLVGVITNGTAVLGLGDIGPAAAKPVMEGKAVLFKRFADVDAFDIEVDEKDTAAFIDLVCKLSPTFGGINLEDIGAPACFEIERSCQERLDIPVFHDDQHGTAIVAAAGLLNAVGLIDKKLEELKVVFCGAGAAGFATAKMFLSVGVRKENLILTDVRGVVYEGRGDGNYLDELAATTDARTLAEAIEGADAFVGVSVGGALKPEMLASMARDPLVFALANPTPEIDPQVARSTRSDVILATGRSDLPNQINNVIAFPYLFRGALDVRARKINTEMKRAAVRAIAGLAGGEGGAPSRDAIIPKPFDARLLPAVAAAVAEAAMASEVARRPVDAKAYRENLERLSATLATINPT